MSDLLARITRAAAGTASFAGVMATPDEWKTLLKGYADSKLHVLHQIAVNQAQQGKNKRQRAANDQMRKKVAAYRAKLVELAVARDEWRRKAIAAGVEP